MIKWKKRKRKKLMNKPVKLKLLKRRLLREKSWLKWRKKINFRKHWVIYHKQKFLLLVVKNNLKEFSIEWLIKFKTISWHLKNRKRKKKKKNKIWLWWLWNNKVSKFQKQNLRVLWRHNDTFWVKIEEHYGPLCVNYLRF